MRQLSLILLLACAGCSAGRPDSRPTPDAALPIAHVVERESKTAVGVTSAELLAQIQVELGDAACDGPQQCHSIAIGAKPCGGPDGYLAWSDKRTDLKKLRSLIERHASARKQENLRNGMMSTCVFETNPGATCEAARCTLRPRGSGSLPDDDA